MNRVHANVKSALAGIMLFAAIALPACALGRSPKEAIEEGERLFLKSFTPGPIWPGGGDGLGPMFNHVSCAGCHRQGAIGGAGDIEFNVTLLCAQLEAGGRRPDQNILLRTLRSFHPAFVTADDRIVPNILLHRFGLDERYFERRLSLGGQYISLDFGRSERLQLQKQVAKNPLAVVKKMNRVQVLQAQRNTTALFGAGLIDRIPDQAFHELAKLQAEEKKVSGRVPPIGPDKVGRFGWRGQQEHLHDFVLGACANELGLEVPGNQQPMNPLKPRYRPKGLDLTEEQCKSLTAYVASLPPPRQARPQHKAQQTDVERGGQLFSSVGCAACHVERMGDVTGIYSDLLLHEMGPELADPVMAEATLVYVRVIPREEALRRPVQPPTLPPATYYGGSNVQDLSLASRPATVEIKDSATGDVKVYRVDNSNWPAEWRTPPLWGLADSAPYLHDGRAADLVEAIKAHGGEAEFAAKQFWELELADRMRLVAFLRSLKAPELPID